MKNNLYLLIALIFVPIISFGQVDCKGPHEGVVYSIGNGEYCAAIRSECFNFCQAEQENDNWCWAACVEMVLKYQGMKISQKEIVTKAYGAIVNRPADCNTTTNAANGWNFNGKVIKAWAVNSSTPKSFIDALAHKYPIIIGLNMPHQNVGHAYVLTAVFYRYDSDNNYVPYKVRLRDPWPYNKNIYETDWADFSQRINCIVHVTY